MRCALPAGVGWVYNKRKVRNRKGACIVAAVLETYLTHARENQLVLNYVKVVQHGRVLDEYQRLSVKTRLNTWSMSKSVVSVAVGMAIDEGLLTLDEKICDHFAAYLPPRPSENLLGLTVRHLLSMTTGLSNPLFFCDGPERYRMKDWIGYFFNAPFTHAPGERFLYSNFNTYMLGCLIEKKSGQKLLEYLRYRLFEPIGIGNPDWTECPMGHTMAANGLYLTVDEMSRFGEFLLAGGQVNGRRLVSEEYLRQATAKQAETAPDPAHRQNSEEYGYGYQFWMNPDGRSYRCSGNYGQACCVFPEEDAVVTIMSLESNYKPLTEWIFSDIQPRLG